MIRTLLPPQPSLLPATHNSITAWPKKRKRPAPLRRQATSIPHCLYSPINYEAGYAYPMIVWLHGPNSSEGELRQVMPLLNSRNYVGVSPRGTVRTCKEERRFGWEQSASAVAESCHRTRQCIEIACNQFNVHDNRIFVAGYGVGGAMALRVGLEHPELFAGAISLGGRVPRGGHAFRRLNAARSLPLMMSVSPNEGEFTREQVMDDLRLLHSGGFSVSLNLYPDGDSLTDVMLADVNNWVMGLACPSTVVA